MQISLIIPIFQASKFIDTSIRKVLGYLDSTALKYEVILINDGSSDSTSEILNRFRAHPRVILLSNSKNCGKFSAISRGVNVARGDVLLFTDGDLPYELNVITIAYNLIISNNFPIVVGDRLHPASVSEIAISNPRRLLSFCLSVILKILFTGTMIDSQCGFKAFHKAIAQEIFPLLKCRRFAGDIEILYIALKHDLEIVRIPVKFVNNHTSTVRNFSDFFEFLLCISLLKVHWATNHYTNRQLRDLSKKYRSSKN